MTNKINSIHKKVPSPESLSPRDGKLLSETRDWLFLSHLLRNTGDHQKILYYISPEKEPVYYISDADHRTRRPVDGAESVIPMEYISKGEIKISSVRKHLRNHYFGLRHNIEKLQKINDREFANTIRVNGSDTYITGKDSSKLIYEGIKPESGVQHYALAALNDSLRWKLDSAYNIEMQLQKNRLCFDAVKEKTERADAICPLDGPVKTVNVDIVSSDYSWAKGYGRHFTGRACPYCLGVFYYELAALS